METRRLLLFIVFSFSLIVLWGEWNNRNQPIEKVTHEGATSSIPQPVNRPTIVTPAPVKVASAVMGEKIKVTTDNFEVEIGTAGGNLQQVALLKHREAEDKTKPIILLQQQTKRTYLAQSGLLGQGLPPHTANFHAAQKEYRLEAGSDQIKVVLLPVDEKNAHVIKTYTFHRGSYLIDVSYGIENTGNTLLKPSAYFQFIRDSGAPEGGSAFIPTYTGPAFIRMPINLRKLNFPVSKKTSKVCLPLLTMVG